MQEFERDKKLFSREINQPKTQDENPFENIYTMNKNQKLSFQNTRLLNESTDLDFDLNQKNLFKMYLECIDTFPTYNMKTYDEKKLYSKWIRSLEDKDIDEILKNKIDIEARCFLMPEDLFSIYKDIDRINCEYHLSIGTFQWTIRPSNSVINTNKNYAFSSIGIDGKYIHSLITFIPGYGYTTENSYFTSIIDFVKQKHKEGFLIPKPRH